MARKGVQRFSETAMRETNSMIPKTVPSDRIIRPTKKA